MTNLKYMYQIIFYNEFSLYPYDLHQDLEGCKKDFVSWIEDMILFEGIIEPEPTLDYFPDEKGEINFQQALKIFSFQKDMFFEVHVFEPLFGDNGEILKFKECNEFVPNLV